MRDYIEQLLARKEMNVVEREVDPKFELAAVIGRSQQENDNPILFRNVKGSIFQWYLISTAVIDVCAKSLVPLRAIFVVIGSR